ncbi:MAG: N-succinylarginine dihydrolase [Phycisphaerales bacterium]|jgi:succinylarginine dihydrolase|nr:N-succinylarginine dihydrolase [Phycisphaerales bacterium]
MTLRELQLDGLVGPTHNYAGLSSGNIASTSHGGATSHPKAAAMQGLDKMAFVASLGVEQAVMPPHMRPDVDALRSLGFEGSSENLLAAAQAEDPLLLAQTSSASAMWTANAATVTPSSDSADGRVHFTPANLKSKFHRAIEPVQTGRLLEAIFPDRDLFAHHRPLLACDQFGDEGAANHTRLATDDGVVNVFVYGVEARNPESPGPQVFPARQTLEASQAVARLHTLRNAVFVQQTPEAIDAGVFHNDVISVGSAHVLLVHEEAFRDQPEVLQQLAATLGPQFTPLVVPSSSLSISEAIQTYLFNSQLLETSKGMTLIAPQDVEHHAAARAVVDGWITGDAPISEVHYLNLRESMQNGGGPACLRLRVPLTPEELNAVHPAVRWSDRLAATLRSWVERWYPASLTPADLADPQLRRLTQDALDDLTGLLNLGSVYPFQQG